MSERRQRRSAGATASHIGPARKLATVALLAAAWPVMAQSPPAESTPFDETIEVRRVNVDVVVVDAAGEPVRDLERSDFALFENGRSVEILNFAEYREAAAAAPPADATAAPEADAAAELAGPVSWVIYVDSGKVAPGPRNSATKDLQDFLRTRARPDDRVLVAGFDGRALRLLCPLTSDRAAVDAALAALAKSASDAVARRSRAQSLVQQMQSSPIDLRPTGIQAGSVERAPGERSQYDPKVDADRFWLELESFVTEEGQRERSALRALDQLLGMISGFDGRVALLLVGAPVDVRPGDSIVRRAQARLGSSPDAFQRMRDVESRQIDLAADLRLLFERANASRVTAFTIDAADEREMGIGSIEETGLPSIVEGARTGSGAATASMALSSFAASTGGRSFRAAPGLGGRLAAIASDLGTYYSLAYEPPRATPGGFHQIEVRLGRPGLVARHRQGVRERDAAEIAADAALAALVGAPPANPFGLRVRVEPPGEGDTRERRKLTRIVVEIPLTSLLLAPELASHRGRIDFHFALLDEHDVLTRTDSKRLDFAIPNERLAQTLSDYVSYEVDLPIAKGSYRLAVVAVDRIGGERSSLTTTLHVAARR